MFHLCTSAVPGLGAVAMLIHSRLEIQTAQPSGFLSHLQVSHWETQSSIHFRDTSNCCQVYRCCPSWLAILGKGVRTGFGSSIAGYKYTARTMLLQLCNITLSCTTPCFALPEAIRPLFDCGITWYFCEGTATKLLLISRHAQDCLHQSALDREVF